MEPIRVTFSPEITITAEEMARGLSDNTIEENMDFIKMLDGYHSEWDFTIALFLLAADMVESDDVLNDVLHLVGKGDARIEQAVNRLAEATGNAKRKLEEGA